MGSGFIGPFHIIKSMCCHGFEQSKESQIKGLEAAKARIEDYLKYIDEQIAELQKEEGEEV
jgi:hypothetical protein